MVIRIVPTTYPYKVLYPLALGLLLIILAIYLGLVGFPYILQMNIKSNIAIRENSPSYSHFVELGHPLEYKVYVFNVTNPEEVTRGEKPILQELGPYIYDEHKLKSKITFYDGDKVSYIMKKLYYFNEKKSGSYREDDIVTTLNIPLLGTGYTVEERFPIGLSFLNSALPYLFPNVSSPFMTAPVGDLLFNGVEIKCNYTTGPAMPVCNALKGNLPPPIREIPGTKDYAFSFFQAVNGTPSGIFKVMRGNTNIYDLGKIVEYNNLTYLSMWERNSTCSKLRGTDSSILPPLYGHEDLYLYLPEVCLSLRASYIGETDLYGVHVYVYESSPKNFASPKEEKDNICRCKKVEGNPDLVCLKSGAIDATKCQGAPVILTAAHFLNCDPEYKDYVVGLSPNRTKHETRVFVEPKTGIPVAAYKRIQMNIFLKKFEDIDILANVSEGLFPLVWVEEAMSTEMLEVFLPALHKMLLTEKILIGIAWTIGAIGGLSLIISGTFYMKFKKILFFKENQIVSNISLANPRVTDDKRTVYNIGITPVQNDNNHTQYSSGVGYPRINDNLKNHDSSVSS